jgi:hypothetical protein
MHELSSNQHKTRQKLKKPKTAWAFGRPKLPHRQMKPLSDKKNTPTKIESSAIDTQWFQPFTHMSWSILDSVRPSSLLNSIGTFETDTVRDHNLIPMEKLLPSTPPEKVILSVKEVASKGDLTLPKHEKQYIDSPKDENNQPLALSKNLHSTVYVPERKSVSDTKSKSPIISRANDTNTSRFFKEESLSDDDTLLRVSSWTTNRVIESVNVCEKNKFLMHPEHDNEVLTTLPQESDTQHDSASKKHEPQNEAASISTSQSNTPKSYTREVPMTKSPDDTDSKHLITEKPVASKKHFTLINTNSFAISEDSLTDKNVVTAKIDESPSVRSVPLANTNHWNTGNIRFEKEHVFLKKVDTPSRVTVVDDCKNMPLNSEKHDERENDALNVFLKNSDQQLNETPRDGCINRLNGSSHLDSKNVEIAKSVLVVPKDLPCLISLKKAVTLNKGISQTSRNIIDDKSIYDFLKLDNKTENRPKQRQTNNLDPLPTTVENDSNENISMNRKHTSRFPNDVFQRRRSVALAWKNMTSETGSIINYKEANTFLTGKKGTSSSIKGQSFVLKEKIHFLNQDNFLSNNSAMQKKKIQVPFKKNVLLPPLKVPFSTSINETFISERFEKNPNNTTQVSTTKKLEAQSKSIELQNNSKSFDKINFSIKELQEKDRQDKKREQDIMREPKNFTSKTGITVVGKQLKQRKIVDNAEETKEESTHSSLAEGNEAVELTKKSYDLTVNSQTEEMQNETTVSKSPTSSITDIRTRFTALKSPNSYKMSVKSPLEKEKENVKKLKENAAEHLGTFTFLESEVKGKSCNKANHHHHHQHPNAVRMLSVTPEIVSEQSKNAILRSTSVYPVDKCSEPNNLTCSMVADNRKDSSPKLKELNGSKRKAKGICTTLGKGHEFKKTEFINDAPDANKEPVENKTELCMVDKRMCESYEKNRTVPMSSAREEEKKIETNGIPSANKNRKMSITKNMCLSSLLKKGSKGKARSPEHQTFEVLLETCNSQSLKELKKINSALNTLPIQTTTAPFKDSSSTLRKHVLTLETLPAHEFTEGIGSKNSTVKSIACSEKNELLTDDKELKLIAINSKFFNDRKENCYQSIEKEVHCPRAHLSVLKTEKHNINDSKILDREKKETRCASKKLTFYEGKVIQVKVDSSSMELKENKGKDFPSKNAYDLDIKPYYEHSLREVPCRTLNGFNKGASIAIETENSGRKEKILCDMDDSVILNETFQLEKSLNKYSLLDSLRQEPSLRQGIIDKPVCKDKKGRKYEMLSGIQTNASQDRKKQTKDIDLCIHIMKKMEKSLLIEKKFDNNYKKLVTLLKTTENLAQRNVKEKNYIAPFHANTDWIALVRVLFFSTERIRFLPRELLWLLVCIKKYGPSTRWNNYQRCVGRKFYQRLQLNAKQQDNLNKIVTENLGNKTVWNTLQTSSFFLDL